MQISKETNKAKALLQEYNACQIVSTDSCCNLCLQDALDSTTLARTLNLCFHTSKAGACQCLHYGKEK